jgi:hypothetical protein
VPSDGAERMTNESMRAGEDLVPVTASKTIVVGVPGTVGGTVPPTLSLSLGGAASFGAFKLAEPVSVDLGKAAWTGPVSDDAVAIGFRRHIGANEPLRTGGYAATLTFTLSTTVP